MAKSRNGPQHDAPAPPEERHLPAKMNRCSLVPEANRSLTECPTNLDLTTARGKALAVAAGSPSDLEFDAQGSAQLCATNYLIFADEGIDQETGELVTFSRTILYDRDGRTFRTSSESAPHALHRLLQLYTADEWAAGIPLVIFERRSRKTGRTYHDMRVRIMPEDGEGAR